MASRARRNRGGRKMTEKQKYFGKKNWLVNLTELGRSRPSSIGG